MRKQIKQNLRRSLCGIISAAMLLSGLSIPELTAYAATTDAVGEAEITEQVIEEETGQSNNEVTLVDGSEQTPEKTNVKESNVSGDSEKSSGEGVEGDEPVTTGDGEDRQQVEETDDENVMPLSSDGVNIYYYIADTNTVAGFYHWGSAITVNGVTSATWTVNDGKGDWTATIYPMEAVSGRSGWYSINITNTDSGETDGFSIFEKTGSSTATVGFKCDAWNAADIYTAILAKGNGESIFIRDGAAYDSIAAAEGVGESNEEPTEYKKTVSLNYYYGDLDANAAEELGFFKWGDGITGFGENNTLLSWGGWGDKTKNPVYYMTPVTDHDGWFNIEYTVDETITLDENSKPIKSKSGFSIFSSKDKQNAVVSDTSGYPDNGAEIYVGLLKGTITAIRINADGELVGHATIEEADAAIKAEAETPEGPESGKIWTFDELSALISEAEQRNQEDYTAASWKVFAAALAEAKKITNKSSEADITAAYEKLGIAKNTLVAGAISVAKIALSNDFITGADLSSYYSLKQSGVVFKDEEGNPLDDAGFFAYLKEGGTNWVRIRVWNDPFDSNKNGYGGGNNDINVAKEIGKLATDAGMKVLIDFHYSDFWADPGKQKEPKAWTGYSVDQKVAAIETYTKESLQTLKAAGVDVGMVQVGNETTNSICGVTLGSWADSSKLFNAGSKAVREVYPDALVAIHFTNPERTGNYANFAKNLASNNVDYDVFASSYYPFWHGTTENLTSQLAAIAETYGKKVMVAETSWATTLDNQDGHDNTVRKGSNDKNKDYGYSVQGQADELRAVIKAVNDVNETASGKGIGVFYWEPAWISKNYVYTANGSVNKELLVENKSLWEQYGSGWAASYAADYDADDAGKWYGGSAIDNQAWFDFFGNALPTAKAYQYIRSGETAAEMAITGIENPEVEIEAWDTLTYPDEVTVSFNDASKVKYPVSWNAEEQAAVDTSKVGKYTVNGIVTCIYNLNNGTLKTEERETVLTITVKQQVGENLLSNAGFEDGKVDPWVVTKSDGAAGVASASNASNSNRHSGNWSLHFYNTGIVGFTAKQEVRDLAAGTYTFGGYAMGEDKTNGADQTAYVEVYNSEGAIKGTRKTATFQLVNYDAGWQNPEITDIEVSEGDYLVVGMIVDTAAGGAWGDLDDFYLYGLYDITVDEIEETIGSVSVNRTRTVAGKPVNLTAAPMAGYMLKELTISGTCIKAATGDQALVKSENGTVSQVDGKVTLTYSEGTTSGQNESFTMPNGNLWISATIEPTGEPVNKTELEKLIAEYDKLEQGYYTDESWQAFENALAKAKEVFENEDATQQQVNKATLALEAAYKGLAQKPADFTALKALIKKCESLTSDGYTAESWKAFADALRKAKTVAGKGSATQDEVDSAKAALEKAYAGLAKATVSGEGLWAEWTDEWAELLSNDNTITYTGKAIKPTVKVYDGETLLTNKSYSVTYKNNTKVGTASVVIKGKGNYTGSCTMSFTIDYVDLEKDDNVSIADLYVAASKNTNKVSVKPVVTWNGKKVNAKLYDVVLSDESEGAYVNPGTYAVEVKAKENNGIYKGSRMISITLADTNNPTAPQVLMSAVKVKFNFKSKQWTDKDGGVTLDANDIKVTYKNENLLPDENYELTYENNDRIGTATVIITGTGTPANGGRFVGELRKTFKITGTALKAKDVKLETGTFVYNGTKHEPTVTIEGLTEGSDFEVTYQNNVNAGKKATAVITGINAYSGTVKKTFTIAAHEITQDDVSVEFDDSVEYAKGGSKPTVEVTFDGQNLVQGTDYTVSYAKNTKLTEGATAEIRIKGKGNYTKTRTVKFAITKQNLENLTAKAADQTDAKKWNKVSPVITDLNGKALKKGTDYEKKFTYKLYQGDTEVTDTTATPPAAGMRVEVTATGKGNYDGTITAEYRIIDSKKNIAKARITVTPQTYTGEAITLSKNDITLELKEDGVWKKLTDDQYEILGYSNNINKGKAAKVTIHGLAPYGGTKTFKFEIKAQSIDEMSWAERIASMFERMFN